MIIIGNDMPMTELEAWKGLAETTLALAGLFQWLSKSSEREQDDADVVECHTEQIEKLSNATYVGVIEAVTGHNLRDQASVKLLQELDREIALAKMRGNRN